MTECTCCGKEVESVRTAYLPKREKQENCCLPCAQKFEKSERERFLRDRIQDICNELNSSVNDGKVMGEMFSKALQREHRYLQSEFFNMLFHFFEDYKKAGNDARNEWCVGYADRCSKAIDPNCFRDIKK